MLFLPIPLIAVLGDYLIEAGGFVSPYIFSTELDLLNLLRRVNFGKGALSVGCLELKSYFSVATGVLTTLGLKGFSVLALL